MYNTLKIRSNIPAKDDESKSSKTLEGVDESKYQWWSLGGCEHNAAALFLKANIEYSKGNYKKSKYKFVMYDNMDRYTN